MAAPRNINETTTAAASQFAFGASSRHAIQVEHGGPIPPAAFLIYVLATDCTRNLIHAVRPARADSISQTNSGRETSAWLKSERPSLSRARKSTTPLLPARKVHSRSASGRRVSNTGTARTMTGRNPLSSPSAARFARNNPPPARQHSISEQQHTAPGLYSTTSSELHRHRACLGANGITVVAPCRSNPVWVGGGNVAYRFPSLDGKEPTCCFLVRNGECAAGRRAGSMPALGPARRVSTHGYGQPRPVAVTRMAATGAGFYSGLRLMEGLRQAGTGLGYAGSTPAGHSSNSVPPFSPRCLGPAGF